MKKWLIAAPLAWAGVVAVVALLAWWVIDGAGEGVLAEPARDVVTPATTASGPTGPSGDADDRPSRSAGSPTDGTGRPDDRPTSSAPPPTSAPPPPPPTATDGATGPTGTIGSEGSAGSTGTGGTSEQSAPVRRTSTWQGEEGLLRVSCLGPDLRLEGATPADGYEIDQNERRSGSELEVRFRSADGDRRVEIEAACVGGAPAFRVERD